MKPRRAFSLRAGVRAVAILLVLSIGVAAQVNYIPSEGPIGSPSIRRLDGSSFTPAKADSEIRRLMSAAHVTGLAVAVINNGEIAYLRTFGWRNVEEHQRLTPETIMYGASFTKSVFAYCVMQLVDDGVVNLDKPVYESLGKPLPDYKNYADLAGNNRSKKLTPRILLSHTSGFPNWRRFTDDQKLTINF